MTDDYDIEKRIVTTPAGDLVVAVESESEGGAAFPVPAIQPMATVLAGVDAKARFHLDPAEGRDHPIAARGFQLEDCVSFYDLRGRLLGHAFLEDGHPMEAKAEHRSDADPSEVEKDILRFCHRVYVDTPGIFPRLVAEAVALVERDCLTHRAAAMRYAAREMEREAEILEQEAAATVPRTGF